jgi:hypothetical protein
MGKMSSRQLTLEIEGPLATCGHCRFTTALTGEFSVEAGRLVWRGAPDPLPRRGPDLRCCCESDPVIEFKYINAGDEELSELQIAILRQAADEELAE